MFYGEGFKEQGEGGGCWWERREVRGEKMSPPYILSPENYSKYKHDKTVSEKSPSFHYMSDHDIHAIGIFSFSDCIGPPNHLTIHLLECEFVFQWDCG